MKKIYFLFIFAVLASMTSAFAATVTIWSEDFSSNSLDGYTTVGSGTKLYTEALAGGTSPEILIAKSGGSLTVMIADMKGCTGLLDLTFKTNRTNITVSSSNPQVVIEGGVTGKDGKYTINVPSDVLSFELTFSNSTSKNIRADDFLLTGEAPTAELVLPEISGAVEGATYFDETRNILITCLTEGAQIYYTVKKDGATIAEKTDAVSPVELPLSAAGVYAIEAKSTKGDQMSEVVTLNFTIATLPFEKMDPSAPKEGTYMIAAKGDDGKYYLMRNSVVAQFYVGATEFDVALSEPTKDTANLFFVEKAEGGYYIKNFDQAYVSLIKSGTHENLKPAEATPFVWTFGGTANAVVAGSADFTGTMRFKIYNGTTPEFLCDDASVQPMFLYVNNETSGVESLASASSVKAVAGGIEVVADKAAEVIVVNAAGQMVAVEAVAGGSTLVELPAGFYIVRVADEVVKVIVR